MLCTVVELMVLAPDGEDGKTERKEHDMLNKILIITATDFLQSEHVSPL